MCEVDSAHVIPFTPEDEASAVEKLGSALALFEPLSGDSPEVRSFAGRLRPFQFKVQLEKLFRMELTHAEVRRHVISLYIFKAHDSDCDSSYNYNTIRLRVSCTSMARR